MPVESKYFENKVLIKESRKVSESICAMANTEGGSIEIGKDNEGDVIGLENKEIDDIQKRLYDAIVAVKPPPNCDIEVVQDGEKTWVRVRVEKLTKGSFCTLGGIIYRRSGSIDYKLDGRELQDFLSTHSIFNFDENTSVATLADVDEALLEEFIKIRNPRVRYDPEKKLQYLSSVHAIADGRLRNGGVLFFTPKPREIIRQHEIRLVRFAGRERVEILDQISISTPIQMMIEEALKFIRRNITIGIRTEGVKGVETPEYPMDALREALVNMVAHRDYISRDASQVNIHPDRIEFINPGRLPFDLTLGSLGSHAVHRNPLIYDLMRDMQLMEGVGTGIPKMMELTRNMGLPPLQFTELGSFFRLTMTSGLNRKMMSKAERLDQIMGYLVELGSTSSAEIALRNGVTVAQTVLDMRELMAIGKVERFGKTRGTRYRPK
jgi:ATP-dependent DNA helicase RecG